MRWIEEGIRLGAGEILLTSMDADGTKKGFDIELTKSVSNITNVPVIASGGCGELEPTIVQDINSNEVLMLAYMSEESLIKTLEGDTTWFYSRSRNELWNKGATSGHLQYVKEIKIDCDNDTLLVLVEQVGAACHTGERSCFYRNL